MNNTLIINKNNLIINNILFKMNLKINQIKFSGVTEPNFSLHTCTHLMLNYEQSILKLLI